ncbi:MAG: M20 family metallopeptidase [Faecalibacillus sp.]
MEREKIDQIVEENKEECLTFLQKIIQIPSETGNEYQISQFLQEILKQEGLQVETYSKEIERPNIISTWIGKEEGKIFMFNGHMDVFPPNVDDIGTYGPYSGKIHDGKIYGRGSADMKGGVAAAIMAIILLKRNGFQPNGIIKLALDVDEENGGKAGVEYLLSQDLLRADFGICMEASQGNIIADSDGRMSFCITYTSDSWFAGTRSQKKNAIAKMNIALQKIYEYDNYLKNNRYYGLQEGGAILSVTEIYASEGATNMNPGSCSITIDRRYTKGETVESATEELKNVLEELYQQDRDMAYQLKLIDASKQLEVDHDSLLIKTLQNVYYDYFDCVPPFLRRCGGGDACKITSQYHYPIPQFGPGAFDQLSIPDESLDLLQYLTYIKMYMNIVIKLLK